MITNDSSVIVPESDLDRAILDALMTARLTLTPPRVADPGEWAATASPAHPSADMPPVWDEHSRRRFGVHVEPAEFDADRMFGQSAFFAGWVWLEERAGDLRLHYELPLTALTLFADEGVAGEVDRAEWPPAYPVVHPGYVRPVS